MIVGRRRGFARHGDARAAAEIFAELGDLGAALRGRVGGNDRLGDLVEPVAEAARHEEGAPHAGRLQEHPGLGGMGAANVLWIRCRPAVIGQYLPTDHVDLVLSAIANAPSVDELSFEYLATSWLIGREAAETLRLEPLFGSSPARSDGAEATALRHAIRPGWVVPNRLGSWKISWSISKSKPATY